MTLVSLGLSVTLGLCLAMAGAWWLQRKTGNGGWADAVWTLATGVACGVYALTPTAGYVPGPRGWLIAILVATWSLRLGLHLAVRAARSAHEDARYAELRRAWGSGFQILLFGFLQGQALASALLTLTMLAAARNPAPFPVWSDWAGLILLALAIAGEARADAELARFKSLPANRGRICDAGLWAWSRHPNYFFEWLSWLAYSLIAIGPAGASPLGWAAPVGPLAMFVLLRFVSGVPPTESAMAKSRGPSFANYQARVGAFFPWPPRSAERRRPA